MRSRLSRKPAAAPAPAEAPPAETPTAASAPDASTAAPAPAASSAPAPASAPSAATPPAAAPEPAASVARTPAPAPSGPVRIARKEVVAETARPVVRRVSRAPAPLVPVAPEPAAEDPAPVAEPVVEETPRRGLFRRMIDAVRGPDDEPETPEEPVEEAPAATVSRSAAPAPITPREAPPSQSESTVARSVSEPTRPGGPAPRAGVARSQAAPAIEAGIARTIDSTAPALDLDPPRPAMTTRRVARSENATPHLQLVASDGQPRLQRSAAERIAEHTGGAIETGEGGLRTVHFPAPGDPSPLPITHQPYTITRALSEGGTSPETTTPTDSSTPAAASKDPEADKAAEREAMYEYFLDRFKRDLLAEREQSGYLIIDNP